MTSLLRSSELKFYNTEYFSQTHNNHHFITFITQTTSTLQGHQTPK